MNSPKTQILFETLITQHAQRGFHFAYRLTGNEQSAHDLVQQTLVKSLTNFDKYQRSRPFAPWFNQILKNVFLDGVRKIQHKRTVSLDGPSPLENLGWEQLIAGKDPTPLEKMEKEEIHASARKALNLLPSAYRLAITLCDIDRVSYKRMAEILGCPLGTVRSRIHTGRILLRRAFERLTSPIETMSLN